VSFFIFRRLRFGHCLVIMALKIAYLKVKEQVLTPALCVYYISATKLSISSLTPARKPALK
jgi:hypothetical protein